MITLKTLRWEIILDYMDGPDVVTSVLIKERDTRRDRVRERERERFEEVTLLALKMEEGSISQEMQVAARIWKR